MKQGSRERIDIMYEVLKNISEYEDTQRSTKTRIMGMCNCNWLLFTEILDTLVDWGYVEWFQSNGKRKLLKLTESGRKHARVLGEISVMVDDSKRRLRSPHVISRTRQVDIRSRYLESQK